MTAMITACKQSSFRQAQAGGIGWRWGDTVFWGRLHGQPPFLWPARPRWYRFSGIPALPQSAPPAVPLDPREAQDGADLPNPQSPLLVIHERKAGVPFILIEGGVAQTRRAALRCGVNEFVQEAGAQAGLNGTFFADASLRGTDHILIGPSLCGNEAQAVFNRTDNVAALTGRPLVLLSPGRTRILPYNPKTMATQTLWPPACRA